ncbi:protein phosphatase 2C domain-containing protein [Myxosarcina sp. GI1]|uniref:protein phosphatase 2C domain-containing protein n=1 Tax=Myxosarcina sp. GI1 TaxID=1541065 RepID=UPI000567C9AA|nr:protein phosphatase 2C domain-containing protein [Myxosarcina sp. GI1]
MPNQILAFSLPKISESAKSNQDRFARSLDGSLIALSDGAGSSLYPKQWAKLLVEAFCHAENPIDRVSSSYHEWLKPIQEQWRQYYLAKITNPNRQWWQAGSASKRCGFATFLGLSLSNPDGSASGKWQAVAVGDSCLFKLEPDSDKLLSFPLENSEEFKSTTKCWSSLPDDSSFPPQFLEGYCQQGDIFLLATDALSQWLLANFASQSSEWKQIFELQRQEDFVRVIQQLRQKRSLKNDDTTAILIKILDEVSILPIP